MEAITLRRRQLWPSQITENGIKTPATIMKEQASTIAQRTNNQVYAKVARADAYIPNNQGVLMYRLELETPARPRYSYRHFFMTYDLDFYPVEFYMPDEEMHHDLELFVGKRVRGPIPAESEEEFIEIVDYLLKSEDLQQVVSSMQAWSHSEGHNGSVNTASLTD